MTPTHTSKLAIVYRPLAALVPYARNARTHSDMQVAAIVSSVREFGWTNPILVDEQGGIIAGHGRVLAAQKMGLAEVPTITLSGLSEAQRRAYVIADNRLALDAGWDAELLALELQAVVASGLDLSLTGFSDKELEDLIRGNEEASGAEPEIVEDTPPDPPKNPVTKPGDVWQLGRHRLWCGSSTEAGCWAPLLEGARVDLVFTDPPYGVDYVGKTADALPVHNDDAKGLPALLAQSFDRLLSVCRPGAVWYVCAPPGPPTAFVFVDALRARGLWRQSIAWVKDQFVLGFSDFHWQHEQIFYGWVQGPHRSPPDRTQTTVWSFDRPKRSEQHPTMKPVALVAHALALSSAKGEHVADAFLGSGTTLIAAEQLERTAYGIELSPAYCDVIVQRWEALTSGKATRTPR